MDTVVNDLLVKAILAIIAAIGACLIDFLMAHRKEKRFGIALSIARIVVQAVEQVAKANGLSSIEKLATALSRVRVLAEKYGIQLTDAQWQLLIEQAVYELNQFKMNVLAPIEPAGVFVQGSVEQITPADAPPNVTPLPTN